MMITDYSGNKYLYFNTNDKDTEKKKNDARICGSYGTELNRHCRKCKNINVC